MQTLNWTSYDSLPAYIKHTYFPQERDVDPTYLPATQRSSQRSPSEARPGHLAASAEQPIANYIPQPVQPGGAARLANCIPYAADGKKGLPATTPAPPAPAAAAIDAIAAVLFGLRFEAAAACCCCAVAAATFAAAATAAAFAATVCACSTQ